MNSFLDQVGVPVRVLMNKLVLIPKRTVSDLVGMFRNGRTLGTSKWCIPVRFFDSLLHGSPRFHDVDLQYSIRTESCRLCHLHM